MITSFFMPVTVEGCSVSQGSPAKGFHRKSSGAGRIYLAAEGIVQRPDALWPSVVSRTRFARRLFSSCMKSTENPVTFLPSHRILVLPFIVVSGEVSPAIVESIVATGSRYLSKFEMASIVSMIDESMQARA